MNETRTTELVTRLDKAAVSAEQFLNDPETTGEQKDAVLAAMAGVASVAAAYHDRLAETAEDESFPSPEVEAAIDRLENEAPKP